MGANVTRMSMRDGPLLRTTCSPGYLGAVPPRDILEVLRTHWGHAAFRSRQEEIVRSVLAGRDTLALLPTGAGKSICFQVPTLAMGRMCLVISPLIALMKDQVQRLKQRGIGAVAITSGMRREEIDHALDSCVAGRRSFLYVSPERLGTELFTARLPKLPIGLIAVDEAHCISQWGYDFRPAYLRVSEVRQALPGVPVLALTASATPDVVDDILARLAFRERNVVRASFRRPEITYWVSAGEDKTGRLLRIARGMDGTGVVYVRERKGTMRIARLLQQHGITAAAYHAGMDLKERDRVQQAWSEGRVRFVAATTAFGMGIDKADVRAVVHMEPPADPESYYQEAGRAGRDGQRSYAILLHSAGDAARARERLAGSFPALSDVRRVYQAFADMHHIAVGAGTNETYGLDLRALAMRVDLGPVVVANALKALELDGRIALSDGAREPSRAMIIAPHTTVYRMRVDDDRLGPVLEALLRMHGGTFEEAVAIDEERLARHLGWTVERVDHALRELDHQGTIVFVPRRDGPAITLLAPRNDAATLRLDPGSLEQRQQRATARLDAMFMYLGTGIACREQALLAYFGETGGAACGHCDLCRAAERRQDAADRSPLHAIDPQSERARWELEEGLTTGDPAE